MVDRRFGLGIPRVHVGQPALFVDHEHAFRSRPRLCAAARLQRQQLRQRQTEHSAAGLTKKPASRQFRTSHWHYATYLDQSPTDKRTWISGPLYHRRLVASNPQFREPLSAVFEIGVSLWFPIE